MRKIGIVGSSGMVGGALKRYFQKKSNYQLFLYDISGEGSLEEVNKADYIYICVPTPTDKDGVCDTSIIGDVLRELKDDKIVILKSTVIPGTTELLQIAFPQFKFLFNPEFLTEETSDQDMSFPDRQIVGYTEDSFTIAGDILQQLPLAPFSRIVPVTVAEMSKYFNNTWFSTKVIFANQMYDICRHLNIDYDQVRDIASADKRVGRTHLEIFHKGFRGYGGKCLPKDTKALIGFAKRWGIDISQIEMTDKINDELQK